MAQGVIGDVEIMALIPGDLRVQSGKGNALTAGALWRQQSRFFFLGLCFFLLLKQSAHTANLLNPADRKADISLKGQIPQGYIIRQVADALHHKTVAIQGYFFPHQFLIRDWFINLRYGRPVLFLLIVGKSLRSLLNGTFIREIPVDAQPSVLLKVIDTSAIIGKTILALHSAGHIFLRSLFGLRQRLVIQPFINPIFKMMVHHHFVRRLHALGIAVDVLHSEPFRFIRQGSIEFTHFCDLFPHVPSPQVLFRPSASAQEVVTVGF